MDNIDDAKKLLEETEKTDSSYAKVGDGSNSLVISFGHIAHGGFASKTSLLNLKYIENKDIDMLYMRDVEKRWYLSSLGGIGKCFQDTITFLNSHVKRYKNIICIGSSQGGYASILFGNILNSKYIVANMPQTNLEYVIQNVDVDSLEYVKINHSTDWEKYQNLSNVISGNVRCILSYPDGDDVKSGKGLALHGEPHYDCIKHHKNINRKYNFDFNKEVANLVI